MRKKIKFNDLIPELSVSNLDNSIQFYQSIGFKVIYTREEDKLCFLQLGQAQIMIQEVNDHWSVGTLEYPFGRGINLSIAVKDIDKMYQQIKEKYPLYLDLEIHSYRVNNKIYQDKEFIVLDPDGYMLRFNN